jgi:L,D-peptidoglycan transpeptidase YkuD (ErfK/YbiS/YcfS/YnhG family)
MIRVTGNTLVCEGKHYRCAIGKGGFASDKHEGDGTTPIGEFSLRECWYRADRLSSPPHTSLPLHVIGEDDGWCDDPRDANYNRPVQLPYPASHENLWRGDRLYDVVVPIGYNDSPVIPGRGSAIFMHVATADYAPTEGCVALALADLLEVLQAAEKEARITLRPR